MLGGIAGALGLPSTEALVLLLSLIIARPLGLLFGFSLISWGIGQSTMLRMGFAAALGMPLAISTRTAIEPLLAGSGPFDLALLVLKEFVIGYGLGFLASLPFLAYQYAGEVIDNYRGESAAGHVDPMGGSLGTWGVFFPVICMLIFTMSGGLQHLIRQLYESYILWPVISALPDLSAISVGIVLDQVQGILRFALILAAPVLFVLMAVDLALAIASRIAQRFQIMSIEFSLKNLVAVLLLPAMVMYLLSQLAASPIDLDRSLGALRLILP